MATLSAQIQALAGTGTGSEMADWMTDGAREIINILPPKLKEKCSQITALTDGSGTDMDGFGDILHVTRETGNTTTIYAPCRRIPSMYGGMAEDSSSLMYYGTATDPVYWIESNSSDHSKLFIKPDPTASQDAKIYHIGYPSFTTGDTETWDIAQKTTITNFPDEAEYLVVLYAAIKVLQNKMNEKSRADLSLDSVLPPIPPTPSFTTPTIGDVTISPTLLTNLGTPPIYNSQIVAPDFADANTWLNTEEDSEMVASRVQIIQGQIQDFQAKVQNELNVFNKENIEYQAKLQEAVQQAQIDSQKASQQAQLDSQDAQQEASLLLQKETQEYANKLQKYSAEVSGYQAEVGKKVQEFQQNFQKDSQEYQWLQSQQVKLQQDYNQGIQLLIGGGAPQQQQGER